MENNGKYYITDALKNILHSLRNRVQLINDEINIKAAEISALGDEKDNLAHRISAIEDWLKENEDF